MGILGMIGEAGLGVPQLEGDESGHNGNDPIDALYSLQINETR